MIYISKEELAEIIKQTITDVLKGNLPIHKKYLTIDEAAEITKLSKATIYVKVCKNEIPHMKKGKRLYFLETELISWMESR